MIGWGLDTRKGSRPCKYLLIIKLSRKRASERATAGAREREGEIERRREGEKEREGGREGGSKSKGGRRVSEKEGVRIYVQVFLLLFSNQLNLGRGFMDRIVSVSIHNIFALQSSHIAPHRAPRIQFQNRLPATHRIKNAPQPAAQRRCSNQILSALAPIHMPDQPDLPLPFVAAARTSRGGARGRAGRGWSTEN